MKTGDHTGEADRSEGGAEIRLEPSPAWNETERLEALARYGILDTPREPEFDDVVRLAADVFEAPIAVVNLIAEGRQWFKAEVGIGADELPLEVSICAHAILQPGVFVVPDTTQDERFNCNPLVTGEPGLRFYAGALLDTPEGLPLGTVCVLDTKPRPGGITDHQRLTLEVLARQVMTQLELRRALSQRDQRAERLEAEIRGRGEAEAALEQTTRRLNAVLSNTRMAVFLMDEHQYCTYANTAAEALTGYTFAQMQGRALHEVVHHKKPDGSHYPLEECPIDRAFPERAQMSGEELFVAPDGSFYPVAFTASPVNDDEGHPIGTVIEARSIAEEKARDAALRESEQQFRLMADAVPQIVWLTDASGRVEFFNKQWFDYVGSAEPPSTAADVSALHIHPDDQAPTMAAFAEAQRTGTTYLVEHRIRSAGGDYRWFLVRGEPHRDAETGEVVRWFGASVDIDDRKLAEEALRDREARLAFLDRLSAATAPLADADAVLATTTRLLGEHLDLAICAYADMDEDQDGFTIRGDWAAPGSKSIVGHYRLADFGKLAVVNLGAGQPLVVNDNLRELAPEEAATFQSIGIASTICMPLVKGDRLTALMAIHDRVPRVWTEAELNLLREVTARSWAHVERVGAVAELRASEARLRELNDTLERQVEERAAALRLYENIVQSDRSPVCAFDKDYRLIAFNRAHNDEFRRVNGFETKVGDVFPDLFIPEQGAVLRELMSRALSGERFTVIEEFGRPELDKPYWEINYTPLRDGTGEIIGAFHHARDISERLRAEAQLTEAFVGVREAAAASADGRRCEGAGERDGRADRQHLGTEDRPPGQAGRRSAARDGRREPARDGDPEPGGQRARRNAGRWRSDDLSRPRVDPVRASLSASARTLCPHLSDGHRRRHGSGDALPRCGAVLLDQGDRQGNRPRAVDGARPRLAVGGGTRHLQRPRRRRHDRSLASGQSCGCGGRGADARRDAEAGGPRHGFAGR
jgi:PAS domain S-box-containing protein